jgi:hypothetical protein
MSAPRGNAASTAPAVHDAERHHRRSHGSPWERWKTLPRLKSRHTGMDAGIQAMDGNLKPLQMLHLGTVVRQNLPSLDDRCIRDIHVPHPSGGVAVQIGCPADLSDIPDRNDGVIGCLLVEAPRKPRQ